MIFFWFLSSKRIKHEHLWVDEQFKDPTTTLLVEEIITNENNH